MESQRNQQGEMVDNQTVNKTNKHLKKRKMKIKEKKKIPGSGTVEFQS
jgi:homospermidine synthase